MFHVEMSHTKILNGGAEGIRIPGLRDANAALSQLSYSPKDNRGAFGFSPHGFVHRFASGHRSSGALAGRTDMVGIAGVEPAASASRTLRSTWLSYIPFELGPDTIAPARRISFVAPRRQGAIDSSYS